MTSRPITLTVLACAASLWSATAHATADGPDHYQVTGVQSDDVLNIRATPAADGALIGTIPAGTNGVMAFGCIGGLSLQDWQDASETERAAASKTRWCIVGHDRTIGWAAGWFLSEGSGPDTLNAGGRLSDLAGSEWLLRDLGGTPAGAEAWIGFKSDGTAAGNSGCNMFNGRYDTVSDGPIMGPVAMTRRACMGSEGETEQGFMQALAAADRIVATHLLLALFDADDRLVATLTRRDAD